VTDVAVNSYRVTHRTEYRYPASVSASFGQVVMLPRDVAGQSCLSRGLVIDPEPHDLRERLDFFGNRVAYFSVLAPHSRLSVTATSVVRVGARPGPDELTAPSWEQTRDRLRGTSGSSGRDGPADWDARQFVLDSPKVSGSSSLVEYAALSFRPGRSVLAAAVDLSSRIHRDFEYLPGATRVNTTIDEVLHARAGVCQDFAHLAIGCLRSLGLAARYVSGYLETIPPPGKQRLVGADVSHAWLSVFVTGTGWVDLDPTNDKLVDDRYVTTAWGRDYSDVAPLKGVIFTDAPGHDLRVSVDVLPLDREPQP
jgi:transglutaminase-like putative cysteine protease